MGVLVKIILDSGREEVPEMPSELYERWLKEAWKQSAWKTIRTAEERKA